MFNSNTGFSMPVMPAYGGNGGMGGFGDSWIGLIIVLALLFGDGNGFGGLGGFCGGKQNCATPADLTANSIVQKLDGITYGISDSTFALSNSINNGFHGVDNAICNLGYQTQSGFNGLSAQLAQCCCDTGRAIERGFAETNYNMATQACDTRNLIQSTTRDIIDGQNANTRAILDFLTTDKIASLQAENQSLKLAASQSNQNAVLMAAMDANKAEILRRTGAECPTAAYIVQPPQPVTFPTNCCGQFSGYNNGCGCGNF